MHGYFSPNLFTLSCEHLHHVPPLAPVLPPRPHRVSLTACPPHTSLSSHPPIHPPALFKEHTTKKHITKQQNQVHYNGRGGHPTSGPLGVGFFESAAAAGDPAALYFLAHLARCGDPALGISPAPNAAPIVERYLQGLCW